MATAQTNAQRTDQRIAVKLLRNFCGDWWRRYSDRKPISGNEYQRNRVSCRGKLVRPELDNLRANYLSTAEHFLETKDRP